MTALRNTDIGRVMPGFGGRTAVRTAAASRPKAATRDAVFTRLFEEDYANLVRLAALLGADDPENIVAEAFYQSYRRWHDLREINAVKSYLKSVVCNLIRMRIRHLRVERKYLESTASQRDAAGQGGLSAESLALLEDDERCLLAALRQLPPRQREALVLRNWLNLSEGQMASIMGISPGSVKTHLARGLAALTKAMEARK